MNMDRDAVRGISDTHLSAVASCCPRRLPMSQTRGRATPGTSNWVKVEATTSLGHLLGIGAIQGMAARGML